MNVLLKPKQKQQQAHFFPWVPVLRYLMSKKLVCWLFSLSQRKSAPKVSPAFEKPIEHVLKSWSMNEAGIVDLSTLLPQISKTLLAAPT